MIDRIMELIKEEALRGREVFSEYDKVNSRNDYISYSIAYLGRAVEFCRRNEREQCDPEDNLIKAAGLIVNALTKLENLKD